MYRLGVGFYREVRLLTSVKGHKGVHTPMYCAICLLVFNRISGETLSWAVTSPYERLCEPTWETYQHVHSHVFGHVNFLRFHMGRHTAIWMAMLHVEETYGHLYDHMHGHVNFPGVTGPTHARVTSRICLWSIDMSHRGTYTPHVCGCKCKGTFSILFKGNHMTICCSGIWKDEPLREETVRPFIFEPFLAKRRISWPSQQTSLSI